MELPFSNFKRAVAKFVVSVLSNSAFHVMLSSRQWIAHLLCSQLTTNFNLTEMLFPHTVFVKPQAACVSVQVQSLPHGSQNKSQIAVHFSSEWFIHGGRRCLQLHTIQTTLAHNMM